MSHRGITLLFEDLADGVVDAQVLGRARDRRRHGIAELEVRAAACPVEAQREAYRRVCGGERL